MVDYSTWVSTVRTEAVEQGADLSKFEENSAVISVAASIWNDRKEEIRQADGREAQEIAGREVNVS